MGSIHVGGIDVSHNDDHLSGISIICVYNDPDVRRECLDRSIETYRGAVDLDYVAVDNTNHAFTSAGAALNHGVGKARHDVVVFVHQDVYLHSIDRLAVVGVMLGDGGWGLLGANGVTPDGENVGRLRDRVQLIGRPAPTPVDVDSPDEVLFMAFREQVLEHPLTEDVDLAWHAYAVEYGLRLRLLGRRVGAVDMAVTHNSLTINLDKLDVAHRRVAASYPRSQMIRTTCGTIGGSQSRWRDLPGFRTHGWRMRWLRHSMLAAKVRRRMDSPVVVSDIRHEIDLLSFSKESPLYLINLDRSSDFPDLASGPLCLTRYGKPVVIRAVPTMSDLMKQLDGLPRMAQTLILGIELEDLKEIGPRCEEEGDWLVGIHPDTIWLLGRTPVRDLPAQWSQPQAVPLGGRSPVDQTPRRLPRRPALMAGSGRPTH